jgi:hypothetical protein
LGEIVSAIEPHTESDPAALLIQVMVAFGNCIGRKAYFATEADKHFLNMFVVLVGATSKGRKGTSAGYMKRLFADIDNLWVTDHIQSGLSSGEGLIWCVRDPISKYDPVKEKGRVVDYQNVVVDPGVSDKRLLVLESEFASTLHVIGREGNTLSALVRQAWDTGTLRTLSKNCPAKATEAHISIIGHITKDELRRYLDRTETANGFANRFLWVCVKRSKFLPEGGLIPDLYYQTQRLKTIIDAASQVTEMTRDEEARTLWLEVYPILSSDRPGLLGALSARSEAQVMRMACLYALFDLSAVVRKEHLVAALALWEYVEFSIRHIFGDDLGDPISDTISLALRSNPAGLSRTEISKLFNNHTHPGQISRALKMLQELGRASVIQEKTPGRTKEIWRITEKKDD